MRAARMVAAIAGALALAPCAAPGASVSVPVHVSLRVAAVCTIQTPPRLEPSAPLAFGSVVSGCANDAVSSVISVESVPGDEHAYVASIDF